ncbi:ABC transporter ATP-binding protein [Angustibacter peucedani]
MSGPLRVHGSVVRGDFTAELAVDVEPGEVLVVIGPNGAGKTTLLRAVAGLEPLQRGQIELGGRLLDDGAGHLVPPERRGVGLVFQDYRLFPHLSVLDNVAFGARSAGLGRRGSRAVARDWVDRLDLSELAGRRPAQLSGGQAQRVALARALATRPQALLLDEPLAALDARARLEVRVALRRHLVEFGGPVVVVSHDAVEAMAMADRLLVVEAGRVVQEGRPAEVARRPATDYVARLVGLNLYSGRASEGAVKVDGGGVLRGADAHGLVGRVLLAVPPSAVSLHADRPGPGSARNVWQGVVDGLEPLHDRVRVHVEATPSVLVDVTPAAVAELGLAPGSPVWLSVKATEVEIYPDPGA